MLPKVYFHYVVIIGVVFFFIHNLETDPAKLKSHYESYVMKVIFYSKNFKWILLGIHSGYHGSIYFLSEYTECTQGQSMV